MPGVPWLSAPFRPSALQWGQADWSLPPGPRPLEREFPMHTLLPLAEITMIHMIIVGIIGLLLFGKRLPEIGKSLGKSVVEFKKGLSGVEDDMNVNKQVNAQPPQQQVSQQQQQPHVTAQVGQGTTNPHA